MRWSTAPQGAVASRQNVSVNKCSVSSQAYQEYLYGSSHSKSTDIKTKPDEVPTCCICIHGQTNLRYIIYNAAMLVHSRIFKLENQNKTALKILLKPRKCPVSIFDMNCRFAVSRWNTLQTVHSTSRTAEIHSVLGHLCKTKDQSKIHRMFTPERPRFTLLWKV